MDEVNIQLQEQNQYNQQQQYYHDQSPPPPPPPQDPPPLPPQHSPQQQSPQHHSPQPYFHHQVEDYEDDLGQGEHEVEEEEKVEGGVEGDQSDDRHLSKCFKNTLAMAGNRGRRLFKMRRGQNFRRGNMMGRGMQGGRKMLYGRRDSSPTANTPTMRESGVMLTGDADGRRWSGGRNRGNGQGLGGRRGCWNVSLKRRTKCCLKRCRRCRSTCFKLVLILFNFFFMMCGWALIMLGSYIHLNHPSYLYSHLLTPNPVKAFFAIHKIPLFLIGAGMIISIVSFLGCCGACTESVCFLSFYSFFLSIMVLGEVTLGIMSTTLRVHVSEQMESGMMYQITHLYNSTAAQSNETALNVLQLTRAWDSLHQELKCCGVLGPKDFDNSSWHSHVKDGEGVFVPNSCCTGTDPHSLCQAEALLYPRPKDEFMGTHYVKGCLTVILGIANTQLNNFTLTLVCLITIQFLDLVLACVLMSWVKKKQSDYWWGTDDDCG